MKRALLFPVLVLPALMLAYTAFPPFRFAALYAIGRSPQCSFSRALQVRQHARDINQAKDRMLAGMKLIARDPAGYDHYQTPRGSYWIPARANESYMLPFNLAEQETRIYGAGPQGVHPGDIVLDCGANVGVFTRTALDAGASKIVAIEPAPENVECFRRNYREEIASGRVIVVPKGVWDKEDVLTLHIDPANSAADTFVMQRASATGSVQVPLTTIDKLVSELGLPKVDYVKMDIEGAEPNALIGARATIAKFKPRISVSAYHEADHPVRIPKIIFAARQDYTMECGPCAEDNGRVRPDILWFR